MLSMHIGKNKSNFFYGSSFSEFSGSLYKITLNPGPYTWLTLVNKHTGNFGSNGYTTLTRLDKYRFISLKIEVLLWRP